MGDILITYGIYPDYEIIPTMLGIIHNQGTMHLIFHFTVCHVMLQSIFLNHWQLGRTLISVSGKQESSIKSFLNEDVCFQ